MGRPSSGSKPSWPRCGPSFASSWAGTQTLELGKTINELWFNRLCFHGWRIGCLQKVGWLATPDSEVQCTFHQKARLKIKANKMPIKNCRNCSALCPETRTPRAGCTACRCLGRQLLAHFQRAWETITGWAERVPRNSTVTFAPLLPRTTGI